MSDSGSAIDKHVPHAARIYDYLLGGTDHYQVDREAAEIVCRDIPGGIDSARAQARGNRAFLGRVVTHLTTDVGIRQFIDIGTGVPNADNVHAVAQAIAPDTRVVYADNDTTVLAHARELLDPAGSTHFVDGDLRYPAKIMREAREIIDFDQPIAVMLIAVLHFMPASFQPYDAVAAIVDALPSGSYLAISHLSEDVPGELDAVRGGVERYNQRTSETILQRSTDDVARFLDGLELLEPGLVPIHDWRPGDTEPIVAPFLGAVGRKP